MNKFCSCQQAGSLYNLIADSSSTKTCINVLTFPNYQMFTPCKYPLSNIHYQTWFIGAVQMCAIIKYILMSMQKCMLHNISKKLFIMVDPACGPLIFS